jgi:hypothetical protein
MSLSRIVNCSVKYVSPLIGGTMPIGELVQKIAAGWPSIYKKPSSPKMISSIR